MKGPGQVPPDAPCQRGWGRSRAAPCRARAVALPAALLRVLPAAVPVSPHSLSPPFSALGGGGEGV